MSLVKPVITDERGVTVLSFRRNESGQADLDQVRHYFANDFLDTTSGYPVLLIDLTGIATLDSSCLGPLVHRLRRAQSSGGRLAVTGVESPALEEIFALTRFDKVLTIYKNRGEAVAAMAAPTG